MTEILRFLFGTLTDPLGLPIEWWQEYLILLIIGTLAYLLAYKFVGNLYDLDIVQTRIGGKIVHWTVRLFCYVIMWIVARFVIWLVRFTIAHCIIMLVSVVVIIALAIVIVSIKRKRKIMRKL